MVGKATIELQMKARFTKTLKPFKNKWYLSELRRMLKVGAKKD